MEKIELKLIDLPNQKIIKTTCHTLELGHKYLELILDFTSEEFVNSEDKLLGTKEVKRSLHSFSLKSKIAGVDKKYAFVDKFWTIYISVDGVADEVLIHFKTNEEATALYEKLKKWLLE